MAKEKTNFYGLYSEAKKVSERKSKAILREELLKAIQDNNHEFDDQICEIVIRMKFNATERNEALFQLKK